MSQSHMISQQILDLSFVQEDDFFRNQSSISELVQTELAKQVERVLNNYSSPHETIRLDRIELDLGHFSESDLGSKFVDRICEELDVLLQRNQLQDSTAPMSAQDRILETWHHALLNGYLPWWASSQSHQTIENKVISLIEKTGRIPTTTQELLEKAPAFIDKLALQCSDMLLNVIARFAARKQMPGLERIQDLLANEGSIYQELRIENFLRAVNAATLHEIAKKRQNTPKKWWSNVLGRVFLRIKIFGLSNPSFTKQDSEKFCLHFSSIKYKSASPDFVLAITRLFPRHGMKIHTEKSNPSFVSVYPKQSGPQSKTSNQRPEKGENEYLHQIKSGKEVNSKPNSETLPKKPASIEQSKLEKDPRNDQGQKKAVSPSIETKTYGSNQPTNAGWIETNSELVSDSKIVPAGLAKQTETNNETEADKETLQQADSELKTGEERIQKVDSTMGDELAIETSDGLRESKFLRRNVPDRTSNTQSEWEETQLIYVDDSGCVLLYPFLKDHFDSLGLLGENNFKDKMSREMAVHQIRKIAIGDDSLPDYSLVLAKLLCGLEPEDLVDRNIRLEKSWQEQGSKILEVVLKEWESLKSNSPEFLRETFLHRPGRLEKKSQGWRLTVEKRSYDLLLDHLPWTISVIRLPWMKAILFVDWI